MPDYSKLRDLVSHRVELEYDSGARVVGYVAHCKPETGPVQVMVLSKAELIDADGQLLDAYESLPVVPNLLTGLAKAEGPAGRDL